MKNYHIQSLLDFCILFNSLIVVVNLLKETLSETGSFTTMKEWRMFPFNFFHLFFTTQRRTYNKNNGMDKAVFDKLLYDFTVWDSMTSNCSWIERNIQDKFILVSSKEI